MSDRFDIAIVGGGLTGAALALALRESSFKVALLESRPPQVAVSDQRSIALAQGSRLIFERLNLWDALKAHSTPIERIFVSQQHGWGRVEINAHEAGIAALGYVCAYAALQRSMEEALAATSVSVQYGCKAQGIEGGSEWTQLTLERDGQAGQLYARLIVVADGGGNLNVAHVQTHDYRQAALVCNVTSDRPHENRAFERFTPYGPLALLPYQRGWSLIWTASPAQAVELAALDDANFCDQLQRAFGATLGAFHNPTPRQTFPLALKYATRPVAARTVLIGNAAQMLHPVAGQGFNLGLRDVWELARAITTRITDDPGKSSVLNTYFSQRRFDRIATILFTDSLIRLFCKDIPFLKSARGVGLTALSIIPGVKNILARRMMFGTRS